MWRRIEERGRRNRFCVCYFQSDRGKHSVFFTTRSQSPPIWASLSNNNPIVVHRTPTVRVVVWFRQDRGGGACKVKVIADDRPLPWAEESSKVDRCGILILRGEIMCANTLGGNWLLRSSADSITRGDS